MSVLPDILAPHLAVVFCGTAVATASAARGHYFAGPRNAFWTLLHRSGFTSRLLTPDEDRLLLDYGVGITDLVKDTAQSHDRGLDFTRTPHLEFRLAPFPPKVRSFYWPDCGAEGWTSLRNGRGRLRCSGVARGHRPSLCCSEPERCRCRVATGWTHKARLVD